MKTPDNSHAVHLEPHRGARSFNRQIFGQFIEHFHRQIYGGIFEPGSRLSDQLGFRLDVIEAVRDLQVPVVRWPGGCFVSAYHWIDGVGPVRTPFYDKAWHVEDPGTFGTNEFVEWCRRIDAEPFICTNAGTGTPEEMSDWVEYCNGTLGKWARLRAEHGVATPHGVVYWSIGNENYGGWEMGAKTVQEWPAYVAESAKMMLHTDPHIKLAAAATADIDWTLPLLQKAGRYLSYVSIHNYWDRLHEEDNPASYLECMMASVQPDAYIDRAQSVIEAAGLGREVGIAFDEWNLRGWHHPSAHGVHGGDVEARSKNDNNSTYTMADALFSACFLNACLRHSDVVQMACMAPLINTRGPLFVHPDGIVKRTTYHVLWMYANLLEKNVLSTFCRSDALSYDGQSAMEIASEVPTVDAIATCDDGMERCRLLLINRDPDQHVDCEVYAGATRPHGNLPATILSGDSPDAFNDVDAPERVSPITTTVEVRDGVVRLQPHSVTVIEFQLGS